MVVLTEKHVKNMPGYSFLAFYIPLVFLLNLNEVCHYGQNYVLKFLNNEDDDGM